MAYISCNKLWENDFDNIVSKRGKLQDMNINQLKLQGNETYKKVEKVTTNFEPVNNDDVINKGYLDEKLLKINVHISYIENDYNEFKSHYNKQSVEIVLIQRAVKTTIQTLYDKKFVDNFQKTSKVLKDILFTTRRRPDLEDVNDDIQ